MRNVHTSFASAHDHNVRVDTKLLSPLQLRRVKYERNFLETWDMWNIGSNVNPRANRDSIEVPNRAFIGMVIHDHNVTSAIRFPLNGFDSCVADDAILKFKFFDVSLEIRDILLWGNEVWRVGR